MKRKIALISQHASPLAEVGEGDNGAGSIYVARVACELAWMGIQVDVFTCETNPELPEIHDWRESIRVIQVPATLEASQTDLLHDFRKYMQDLFSSQVHTPDLLHATSRQSGWVAAELKIKLGIPFVVSYDPPNGTFSAGSLELDQGVIRVADGIIVRNAREKEDLFSWYDADPTYVVEMQHRFDPETSPDGVQESRSNDSCQSVGSQLAELYEDVLAVRRVMIPSLRMPVLTAEQYGYQNMPEGVPQALETGEAATALQIPVDTFYHEAGMLSLPLALMD